VPNQSGASEEFENSGMNAFLMPVTIMLLSEFKKPLLEIRLEDAWIKSIGTLQMNYQDTSDAVIKHSFTLKYYSISFKNTDMMQ